MSTAGRSPSVFSFALGVGSLTFVAISTLALLFGLGAAYSTTTPTLTMPAEFLAAIMIGGFGFVVFGAFALLLTLTR